LTRNADISVIFRAGLNLKPVLCKFRCRKSNAKDSITLSLLLLKRTINISCKIGGGAGKNFFSLKVILRAQSNPKMFLKIPECGS
jgi:hypothetical protein